MSWLGEGVGRIVLIFLIFCVLDFNFIRSSRFRT